jgi:metal-responsive CopG/Arc/MetJ family transcriptional regulator
MKNVRNAERRFARRKAVSGRVRIRVPIELDLLAKVDVLAKRLKVSRSALAERALRAALAAERRK